MSIHGENIKNSGPLRAVLRKLLLIFLGSVCLTADIAFACYGFVDVVAINFIGANRFFQGGYEGFADQVGKTEADCYANSLKQNGELGANLLSTLNKDISTSNIDKMRGPNPAMKLLVAHRGGPDWANGIPDNSIAAFKKSIANGVSSVELDLQMDSNRNLIAYHDTSFAGTVRTDDSALQVASNKAIKDYEWITRASGSRKLDDSKLFKLRRVIPNKFTFNKTFDGINYLKISDASTLADPSVVVSSFHKAISEIQEASSKVQFNQSPTAVNIFLDAAKDREITIAAINRLRRSKLIASDQIYNDIDSALNVPAAESIAVQFRINHFPGGAEDLARALCNSPENNITYKKSVIKSRQWLAAAGYYKLYRDTTKISYTDSTDNFSAAYGQSTIVGASYWSANLKTGVYYDNGNPPLRLWGDAASGTCNIKNIENSGIAVVPVVEEILPYKVTLDDQGNPFYTGSAIDFARGIMYFLNPFKTYFKMNIIELSYTPLDMVSYYSADAKQVVTTVIKSQDTYLEMASRAKDPVFQNQNYIYQTFNRFFDINFTNSSDSKYNGPYLCSAQIGDLGSYSYYCYTQKMGSLDEQKFEFRAKPGFYTGVCNAIVNTPFLAIPFGLTTTDNPILEIYLNNLGFQSNTSQFNDFCTRDNADNRMSNYTTRYRSFVGNPSFRLAGGI